MKDLAREVAEHHAQHHALHRAQRHATSRATSRTASRATSGHSFARNIKPQHHKREKLTGEIVKPDAKLAHQISQKLRLSRGIGVFTIPSGGRGVSVYLTSFYASGPPVVKLDPILFGVSCRDNLGLVAPGRQQTNAQLAQQKIWVDLVDLRDPTKRLGVALQNGVTGCFWWKSHAENGRVRSTVSLLLGVLDWLLWIALYKHQEFKSPPNHQSQPTTKGYLRIRKICPKTAATPTS